jgi:predicted RNA-binding protein YlqC (UPF0109 family)
MSSFSESVDVQVLYDILINLVTFPDDVKIERNLDEQGVLISVMVNSKDMPIVIGRNGSMATAIKTVMRAVGKSHKMNLRVHFLEPDGSARYGDKDKSQDLTNNEAKDYSQPVISNPSIASTLDEDLSDFVIN